MPPAAAPSLTSVPADTHPHRWRTLALLALAELLGMSPGSRRARWHRSPRVWGLTGSQVGWLTTVVQLGFVAGTAAAALLNLADVLPSRACSRHGAPRGGCNAALLVVPGFGAALLARFGVGFCLAGVYPPAMKMIATWFRSRPRAGHRHRGRSAHGGEGDALPAQGPPRRGHGPGGG